MNEVASFYSAYSEGDRLRRDRTHSLERIVTMRTIEKYLAPGGATADIGAAEGAYSFELAERGQDVFALDITPKHVEVLRSRIASEGRVGVSCELGSALDIPRPEGSFDLVLCFGPYYHLRRKAERARCLAECVRIAKAGAYVAIAYINRGFAVPYYFRSGISLGPELTEKLDREDYTESFGFDPFLDVSFFSTPPLVEAEARAAGLEIAEHIAVDGIYAFMQKEIEALSEAQWRDLVEYHYAHCAERDCLGLSNHGLVVGRKA